MAKVSWIDQLLGGDWADRRAIHETDWELKQWEGTTEDLALRLYELERRARSQATELEVLQAAVRSLVTLMIDHQIVDEATINLRIDEAIADFRSEGAPIPPPPSPSPADVGVYRSLEEPKPAPMTSCKGCCAFVPLSKTNVTERGLLCDDCFAKGSQ